VDEEPSFDDHYGDYALQRDFRFRGIDPGMTVSVRLGGAAGTWSPLWGPASAGTMEGDAETKTLSMTEDGVANIKVTWTGSAAR
jgi:hypothetical protein